jgi:hypothetical protein
MRNEIIPRLEGKGFRKHVDFGPNSLFVVIPAPYQVRGKLQQESRGESRKRTHWIPAFAGMTERLGSPQYLAHVPFVRISSIFPSPESEELAVLFYLVLEAGIWCHQMSHKVIFFTS